MRLIEYTRDGDWLNKQINTGNEPNTPAIEKSSYRHLRVKLQNSQLVNGSTETVTVKVIDGLEVARGTDPAEATVLDYDGDVTVRVDGAGMTKTLTDGSVSFDLTTEKPAGSTITVEAVTLADHPAESDSATIEVIQA